MTGPAWFEVARERATVVEVAPELGLELRRSALGPCPACGAVQRGGKDRRPPVGVRGDGRGWRCHACGVTGSTLDLIARVLTGEPSLRGPAVRAWCASRGLCDPVEGDAPAFGDASPSPNRVPLPRAPAESPKPRPPRLAEWWARLGAVDEDEEIAGYLRGRGIDPILVAERDLARAVPDTDRRPWWAPRGPYRLAVPLYGATGDLASVRVRRCVEADGPKSRAPWDCDASSAVFACPLGRAVLQTGAQPSWWPLERRLEIVIVEGEIDYLALATAAGDADPCAPIVLAVTEGGWTEAIAARIPDTALVTIATHDDEKGHKYANAIGATLASRCDLRRWEAA